MRRVSFLVGGVVFSLLAVVTPAAPTVSVGRVEAPLSGTVSVQLMISDTGNAEARDIEGILLTLQIGDGTGNTPKIQSIDMLTGTIWTGHASTVAIPAGGNHPQFASRSIITDAAGDYVNTNGVLATVVIDTTGADPGEYPLMLNGLASGSDTALFDMLGANVPATISNGVLVVPEPTLVSGFSVLILHGLRRHRRLR